MTPIVGFLLVVNIALFGLQASRPDALLTHYALWPLGAGFEPWQLATGAFLHASLLHLATNMFGLWMFGRDVERLLGSTRFALLYASSVLSAAVAQLVVTTMATDPVPTVGASGGLFGVLGAFALLFPSRRIMLLFPPIPLPAPVFVTLYAAFELYAGVTGSISGVAHFAHLGGLVGGLGLALRWRAALRRRHQGSAW
jgi:membrane associated rhomboid family serine protease